MKWNWVAHHLLKTPSWLGFEHRADVAIIWHAMLASSPTLSFPHRQCVTLSQPPHPKIVPEIEPMLWTVRTGLNRSTFNGTFSEFWPLKLGPPSHARQAVNNAQPIKSYTHWGCRVAATVCSRKLLSSGRWLLSIAVAVRVRAQEMRLA